MDGSERDTFVPSYRSASPEQMSPISEWSALDSDSSPTSEKPEDSRPCATISPTVVIERSRTGRVIIPAWQNRQPRVQPRKISTAYRSCTVSASGTSGFFGYGHLSRSMVVRLCTRNGTSGRLGTTRWMRPSGR